MSKEKHQKPKWREHLSNHLLSSILMTKSSLHMGPQVSCMYTDIESLNKTNTPSPVHWKWLDTMAKWDGPRTELTHGNQHIKRMRHTSYMTFTSEGESHRRKLNNPDLIKIPLPRGCLLWSRPLTTINENIGKYQPVQMCNKNDTKEEIKLPVFADVIILCRNTKNISLKETFRANGVHLGCGIWNKHKKTSFQWYWAITKWNQGTILKAIFKRIKYLE